MLCAKIIVSVKTIHALKINLDIAIRIKLFMVTGYANAKLVTAMSMTMKTVVKMILMMVMNKR